MTELFCTLALPLIACLLMTAILSYLGLHVLKREVVFIDIAVAQVAALGAIVAHLTFHVHADSAPASACALAATLMAALFFAVVRRRVTQIPIEATIGITYAIVAAAALFAIGKSTTGHTHVQQMLTGSLLWVAPKGLSTAAAAFAVSGVCLYLFRKPFQRISDDYKGAAAAGMHIVLWDFLFYALCGTVITAAVQLAGVVVVFCFLIIPATVSALFFSQWRTRLIMSWITGITASIAGLAFSRIQDFSAGVSVALLLGVVLVAASAARGFGLLTKRACS